MEQKTARSLILIGIILIVICIIPLIYFLFTDVSMLYQQQGPVEFEFTAIFYILIFLIATIMLTIIIVKVISD